MKSRLFFILVAVFWVTMNALLWRAEYGGGNEEGGALPVAAVWQKILTAPDNSCLDIYQGKTKLGSLRWVPNVGRELETGKVNSDQYEPDGQIKRRSGYTIDLDGNVVVPDDTERVFFTLNMQFNTNDDWQEIATRVSRRPVAMEVRASSARREVSLRLDDGREPTRRVFSFDDLQNPQKLLSLAPGVGAFALLGGLGQGWAGTNGVAKPLSLGVPWEASYASLEIRHTRIKTYRLHAKLLDRYDVNVHVSRVGEILRVELPDGIRLVSDALPGL